MGDLERQVEVVITALGSTYRVKTMPEDEDRIKRAAALLEKDIEEASSQLNRPMNERVPSHIFYAALGIADELLMLREKIEDSDKSREEQTKRLENTLDKSLISKFIKLKMAYGAERREGRS